MIGSRISIAMMMKMKRYQATKLRYNHRNIFYLMFKIKLVMNYGSGLISYCLLRNALIFDKSNLMSFSLQINQCLKLWLNLINIFLEHKLAIHQILMIFYINYHLTLLFIFIIFLLYYDSSYLYYNYYHVNLYIFYYSVANSFPFY